MITVPYIRFFNIQRRSEFYWITNLLCVCEFEPTRPHYRALLATCVNAYYTCAHVSSTWPHEYTVLVTFSFIGSISSNDNMPVFNIITRRCKVSFIRFVKLLPTKRFKIRSFTDFARILRASRHASFSLIASSYSCYRVITLSRYYVISAAFHNANE